MTLQMIQVKELKDIWEFLGVELLGVDCLYK